MKLLIAKRNGMTDAQLEALSALGFEILEDGDDTSPYTGPREDIGAVICYEFFKFNDMRAFPALRLVHLTSAGYDHMPLDYMRQKGIALYNARGVYSVPIAEFVLWGVLDLYKNAAFFRKNAAEYVWQQTRDLRELSGKNVLILGAGSIAAEISKRFRAMGCRTTALCRNPEKLKAFDRIINVRCLDSLLPEADIVILAAPLNEGTYHIFNAQRFTKMKTGSVFVNIARGALVETEAFIAAMESGRLYGAVMDVFETEPLPADSPIWNMENVIVTPHNSFSGELNGDRTFELIHRDLSQWLNK